MVYLNRPVTWARDGAGYLTESLRLEPEEVARLSFQPLDAIARSLRNRRTIEYLQGLYQEVKHGC